MSDDEIPRCGCDDAKRRHHWIIRAAEDLACVAVIVLICLFAGGAILKFALWLAG